VAYDVLTMGRVSVDVYPDQPGPLEDVATFRTYLGGSPTNVAVAAARHGRRAATITCVGDDPFGRLVRRAFGRYGLDDRFLAVRPGLRTPLAFCEMFPPDPAAKLARHREGHFPIHFYRDHAPDLTITPDELDLAAVGGARIFWATVTGLSAEPSRSATAAALRARAGRDPAAARTPHHATHTVLDLDYRPVLWPSRQAARAAIQEVIGHVDTVVGNIDEFETAVGERDPVVAAHAVRALGVRLAVVKRGPHGVLAVDDSGVVEVPPIQVQVVNGLGAGDAFGGALCHGLLAGWPLERTLRYANAAGALVTTRIACSDAMPTPAEVEALLSGPTPSPAMAVHRLIETRTRQPEAIAEAAAARKRRTRLVGESGRLFLVAADHPARGVLRAGADPDAMRDRARLLERLRVALGRPGVDGVLGTADIIEDLLLLGALDDKVVIGSMNRGGLAGSVFELDDRFTGYDAAGIAAAGLDGGKMLLRLDRDDPASVATMHASARAVDALAERRLLAVVEPFVSYRQDGAVRNDLTPDAVARSIAIAAGLGRTSAYTWLKLPVVDDMERVLATSTLPALLLGGEVPDDPEATYRRWDAALRHPGVRGLVIGRTVLYPADGDVEAAVDAVVGML
jgi:5-dehydro-2-deoxygluconokinase